MAGRRKAPPPIETVADETLAAIPATCLGVASRAASRAASRVFAAHVGAVDLLATQFPVLVMIRLHGADGIAGLAERLDLDASALTRNVQLLERKGLVVAQGGRGRGGKRLALSPEGEIVLSKAVARWRTAQAALLAELGEDGPDALLRTLKRIKDAAERAERVAKAG